MARRVAEMILEFAGEGGRGGRTHFVGGFADIPTLKEEFPGDVHPVGSDVGLGRFAGQSLDFRI